MILISLKFEFIDDLPVKPNDKVKVKTCGHVIEVMKSDNWVNGTCYIKKISDEEYIDLRTGEVKQSNKIKNRSENKESLKKTFAKLRDYINTNCVDLQNIRFVTLTYQENMTDSKRLMSDTEKLRKKMFHKFGKFEYIAVAEPQGRGAWHTHELWIFDGKAPYIDQEWLEKCMWWPIVGKGSVTVSKIDSVDNLGAYLTAYMTDISLSEFDALNLDHGDDFKVESKEINGQIKRFVKGGRLQLYPPKFNIIRKSKGIKEPEVEEMSYWKAQKKIGSAKPTFKKAFKLSDDSGFQRSISYDYYNTLRVTEKE